jgi:pimeloyl-ACP methyl ester carboxylesterase
MSDHLINTKGAAIYLSETGEGEPALLFLHYWGGSSRTWSSVIERLEGKPRCIALDQRGWGASIAADGRYDLAAMADDVVEVARQLGLGGYVLVGHSMGGKVAQIVSARRPKELAGLILVAPAPPTPVPEAVRSQMVQFYGSREGVLQALVVIGGESLSNELREQVIQDTLRGAPGAKSIWPQRGMVEDVTAGLEGVNVPAVVVIGDRDQVEHEEALREIFARFLPQTTFKALKGIGHLSPLVAPEALAEACKSFLQAL